MLASKMSARNGKQRNVHIMQERQMQEILYARSDDTHRKWMKQTTQGVEMATHEKHKIWIFFQTVGFARNGTMTVARNKK